MILSKVKDKTVFRAIFGIIILWNLKYFFLIAQIPFTLLFVDYLPKNQFYSDVTSIRHSAQYMPAFYDEGEIGFVSDIPKAKVFDLQDSIRAFYTVQYAIVPSILKNEEKKYNLEWRHKKFNIIKKD